jgi:hypothetical protein
MLLKQFKMQISAYLTKIAGANDPDYPRGEIVQQMKQTAAAMYTASSMACVAKCDVPDDSPLIMYCFAVGVRALVSETLRAMVVSDPAPDWICSEVLGAVRADPDGAYPVSFTEVEKFIDKVVIRIPALQDQFAGRHQSPTQKRPVTPPQRGADTPPVPGSPQHQAKPSPARQAPRPPSPHKASPQRQVEADIESLARETMHHMGKVGRIEGEFLRTTELMDRLTREVAEQIHLLKEARKRQHFSQSSQLLH